MAVEDVSFDRSRGDRYIYKIYKIDNFINKMQFFNGKFIYLVYLIASKVRLYWVDYKGHFPTSVGFNIKINCFGLQLRRYIK